MNFLKKLGCVLSAAALLVGSCIPSKAVVLNAETDSDSVSVTAKYSAGTVTDIYSVDIQWGSMVFEYTDESRVWNPEKHKYDVTGASWSCDDGANEVKVTNHSNNPITVELTYTPSNAYSEITGEFDIASKTLGAAEENSATESAPNFTALLSLDGELSKDVTSNTVIGYAKVTLKSDTGGEEGDGGNFDNTGEIDLSRKAGTVNISTKAEGTAYSYEADLYDQGNNVYMATIFAETVPAKEDKPNTAIYINNTRYYIYESGMDYEFEPNSTVDISTSYYVDPGFEYERRKILAIEAGKRYLLKITLDESGTTGEATLAEIVS